MKFNFAKSAAILSEHRRCERLGIFCFLLLSFLSASSSLFAREEILKIHVQGNISPTPKWVDTQGLSIKQIDLSFKSVAKEKPDLDIDSQGSSIKLVNANNYPASVELKRPENCSIGNHKIQDKHVYFLQDSNVFKDDDNFWVHDHYHFYALRFSRDGKYAEFSGPVECDKEGSLTYKF